MKLLGKSLPDYLMHVRRGVFLIHKTDFAIHIHIRVVLNGHISSLVTVPILKLLHATIVFKLGTESESAPSTCIEHGQSIANAHSASKPGCFEGRESAQERGAEQQTEFKELIIGQPAQVILVGLFRNPEELRMVAINSSNQLFDIKQEDFGRSKDSINNGVFTFGKVGELSRS